MCSLTRVLLTLSAFYFLDDSEAEQSGEIDTNFNFTDESYSFEDDENEVTGDIQCLFTKAKECKFTKPSKFTKPNKFLFVPVSLNWKEKSKSNVFQRSMENTRTASTYGKWYGNGDAPSSVYRIVADGNCLFRAVSYVVSGSQEHHRMLRKLVAEKMYDMGCEFKRISGQTASEYVADEQR